MLSTLSEDKINKDRVYEAHKKLSKVKDEHKIWVNPLLIACQRGQLARSDFQYFFSQYYFYSKNFTKLLAAGMINCDSDYYRSRLSQNLWEEGGGQDIELRHAEIFRRFLVNHLNITLTDIQFELTTESFFKQYLSLCLSSGPAECAAVLSFATEGIVAKLYTCFKSGLEQAGITGDALDFFNIHIECDDDHALTLEEMALSYFDEGDWLEKCNKAITKALDLRDAFFSYIYQNIQFQKFNTLIEKIAKPKNWANQPYVNIGEVYSNIQLTNNRLYQNNVLNIEHPISFTVDRVPFGADVLDPRLVCIPVNCCNELHSHAHETVFLILSGEGEVLINENTLPIKEGDLIFVPRWSKHQTRNIGDKELKFFAVTDFGFTKRLSGNSESVYRLNKENVSI
jgi:mannose-6-phosphate isomerase-like protein (cupin superfamily)/pyrroloquinoline quinone (PQQ) biosynthesis protein C